MFPSRAHRLIGYHRGVPLGWCDRPFGQSSPDVLTANIITYCGFSHKGGAFELFQPSLVRLRPAFGYRAEAVVRAGDLPEDRAGMPFEMAKVTATAITLVWNFLSKKLTIFR